MGPVESLTESALELERKLERHCRAVRASCAAAPGIEPPCSRIRVLRRAVVNAIETLEGTRRSFKSKQLEDLRKRLVRALAEFE